MRVRLYVHSDYEMILDWWKTQKRAPIDQSALPPLGFIVETDDQEGICVAWLYRSDSGTGFVGWTTVNPLADKRSVSRGLKELDKAIESSAHTVGAHLLFRFSGGKGFSRLLTKLGWKDSLVKHDLFLKEV